jgi:hypothetical protein
LPQNYSQIIKHYDVDANVSTERHPDWFNDFVCLEEVDCVDEKMRIFVQILKGDVRKWVTVMLEYDLEINPTKLVKGRGLANLRV